MYKPERRIPFGFRGDWGTLYKRYTEGCSLDLKNETITFERNNYVDIGAYVQFKPVDDITHSTEQNFNRLLTKGEYMTVETTDAYWNDKTKEFVCCVSPNDIVKVFNKLWIVTEIREVTRYIPKKLSFYYCELKGIA